MFKTLNASVVTVALMTLSGAVLAQASAPGTVMPRSEVRQAHQQARIAQGAASGSLTARETVRLERGQARVEAAQTDARADGVVTKDERREVHRMQDRQSRKIYRQKHDAQNAKQ